MKYINEVGLQKVIKFIFFSLVQILYHFFIDHLFFFPQTRKLFLELLGARIGNSSIIMNVKFTNWYHRGPSGIKIGNECFIGDETLFDLYDEIILENQVTLAPRVTVLTHLNVGYGNHPLQKFFPKKKQKVIFKTGCVIGAMATILPGIIIGRESFVGAGSVVTRNVPKKTLVAGSPAKVIRKIK